MGECKHSQVDLEYEAGHHDETRFFLFCQLPFFFCQKSFVPLFSW